MRFINKGQRRTRILHVLPVLIKASVNFRLLKIIKLILLQGTKDVKPKPRALGKPRPILEVEYHLRNKSNVPNSVPET